MTDSTQSGTNSNFPPPPPGGSSSGPVGSPQSKPQWYEHIALVIVACLCCWPIGVALIWINRSWTTKSKIIATSIIVAVGLLFGVLTIVAGANSPKTESSSSVAVKTTSSTTTPMTSPTTAPAATIATTTTVKPTTTTTTKPAPTTTTKAAPQMPNVVGMNLQDAQDTIQNAGVFFSRSYDCTGAGRSQIVDSNWLVITQNIAPGTPFGESDAVLGVVKYGEALSCR